jgi:hypothetical protein
LEEAELQRAAAFGAEQYAAANGALKLEAEQFLPQIGGE